MSEKKQKTVRFKEDADISQVTMGTSLDQKKDIAIYSGYCILKNVMDAILFCAKSSDQRLTHPIKQKDRQRLSYKFYSESGSESGLRSRSDSNLTNCDTQSCDESVFGEDKLTVQNLYEMNVTAKLKQVQSCLSVMQPLTFRLEVIEDVFSLLFLTHEDIQETLNLSEYGSDEHDDKRSNSTGIDSPQSPLKGYSSEGRDTYHLRPDPNPPESTLDYDVPFEDIEKTQKKTKPSQIVDMEKVGEKLRSIKQNIVERISKDLHNEKFQSSHSENFSSMSANNSMNLVKLGLIVNEYLVRDILSVLRDSVVDLSSAKYHLYGNKTDSREKYRHQKTSDANHANLDPSVEEALCHLVKSSVSMETLQKRLTQLEKFISEALWRFQIVCNRNIPKTPGQVLGEVHSDSENSDEEVEVPSVSANQRRRASMYPYIKHLFLRDSVSSSTFYCFDIYYFFTTQS